MKKQLAIISSAILVLSIITASAQAGSKHHRSTGHHASRQHKTVVTSSSPHHKHNDALQKTGAGYKHTAVPHHNRKKHRSDSLTKIPLLPSKEVRINDFTATAEVEIRNGYVYYNDSFLFRIKNLRREDDKIRINYVAPFDSAKLLLDASSGNRAAKAELGVFACDDYKNGALIDDIVPCSPADKAGMEPGDVITGVNSVAINDKQDLLKAVSSHSPGDNVTITFRHYYRLEKSDVVLGNKATNYDCGVDKRSGDYCFPCGHYFYRGW